MRLARRTRLLCGLNEPRREGSCGRPGYGARSQMFGGCVTTRVLSDVLRGVDSTVQMGSAASRSANQARVSEVGSSCRAPTVMEES